MLTDTLPELAQKKADIKASLEQLDELTARTLAACDWIKEWIHTSRATLEGKLRQGVEALEFARELQHVKGHAEEVLDVCVRLAQGFADWKPVATVLPPIMKEAENLVGLIDDLLTRLTRPRPPIDESKLPQVPAAPPGAAPGFISIPEARSRLRQRRKQ